MSQFRRIITYVFAVGMVAAPFVALLYDLTAGLGVLTAALAATTYVAFDAAQAARAPMRQRLLILAGVNGVLGVVAAGLFVARVAGFI